MWNFLLAVDALGPADLIVLDRPDDNSLVLLHEALPAWTVECVPITKRQMSAASKFFGTLHPQAPTALQRLDLDGTAERLRPFADARDLIVAIQAGPAALAQRVSGRETRVLVDLWDIEEARLKRILVARPRGRALLAARRLWLELRDRMDIRAWRQFHRALIDWAAAVTVCSEVDRAALTSGPKTHVVPNGADVRPLVHRELHDPPTILYHGQLTYPPNADAAAILVEQILPLLNARCPEIRVRIVGRADERVLDLHAPPAVTVTGFVDDIDVELAGADVLVVPLRIGGGTRLKILEAFSASLPVVSTAVGAEGLDTQDEVHLLIADSVAEMAAAVLRVLSDSALRTSITARAHALVEQRFDWTAVRRDLTELVRSLR